MPWQPPRSLIFPWTDRISARLTKLNLPAFSGPDIWTSSDYGFDNPSTDFDVVGLLLVDPDASEAWGSKKGLVRDRHLSDGRKLEWKKLSDKRRQKAFFPFLTAADSLHGVLVGIAIHRVSDLAFSTRDHFVKAQGKEWLDAGWNTRTAEQLIRIAYFTAMFVAGLSHAEQNIVWISDQDAVFANDRYAKNCGMLFTKFLRAFSQHEYGTIQIGTTAICESDMLEEDLNSLPDLIVGATGEIMTAVKREFGDIPRVAVTMPSLTEKCKNFLAWLESPEKRLQRVMCFVEKRRSGEYCSGVLKFS